MFWYAKLRKKRGVPNKKAEKAHKNSYPTSISLFPWGGKEVKATSPALAGGEMALVFSICCRRRRGSSSCCEERAMRINLRRS